MKQFVRKVFKSDWKKLPAQLSGYGFVAGQHFFYNRPLTIAQLARALARKPTELAAAFPDWKPESSQPLPEPALQEFILGQDLDFTLLKNWTLADSLHHWLTTPPIPKLTRRAPVIAIMGHVDHGKTTLLDQILASNHSAQEVGAITQKLGASTITVAQEKMTFLDTPGHHFFSLMRQQGASIADLAILVVSGVEGVRPQTKEALQFLQEQQVPTVVFVNKSDLPGFNLAKTEAQLAALGLATKQSGGNTLFVAGSAKSKKGLPELFVALKTTAAKINLQSPSDQSAQGVVVDWQLSAGGVETNLLITSGQLSLHDHFWAGGTVGKVRTILNSHRQPITTAVAGEGVIVLGFKNNIVPSQKIYFGSSADLFKHFPDPALTDQKPQSPLTFFEEEPDKKQNIIVKFSGKGFEQALASQIPQLKEDYQKLNFVTISAEDVTQKDIIQAQAHNAIIVTFNLPIKPEILKQIEQNSIAHHSFSLLHEAWEFFERLANVPPSSEEIIVTGSFEVLKIFPHSKYKFIAGGVVRSGKLTLTNSPVRVFRNGEEIANKLKINSLRTEREFVNEVPKGSECGIIFPNYSDFAVADKIEQYTIKVTKNEI